MLVKNEIDFPRVKNRYLALLILNSMFLFNTFFYTSGLKKVWEKWKKNKPIKFPRHRAKAVINFFLRDMKKDERKNQSQITKTVFFKAIDKIHFTLEKIESPFSNKFISYLKSSFSKKSISNTEYFKKFVIDNVRNEIRREFLNRKLSAITIDINNICNRNCKHCFASSDLESKTEIIEYDVLKKALLETREKFGCRFFNILGGEPLLSLSRITQLLNDFPYIPIQIFTNGTLVNKETADILKNYPNVALLISIEGDAKITDNLRGSESFKIAENAFKILKKSPLVYGAAITANNKNFLYTSSEKFAKLLSNFGCFYVWVFDYKPIGRAKNTNLQLNDSDKKLFNERVKYLNKNYPILFINTEKDPEIIGGCPATKGTILHIAANGRVMPCIAIRYSDKKLNIRNISIEQIVDSDIFKSYKEIGSSKGCAQKYFPREFKDWIRKNELGPIYD